MQLEARRPLRRNRRGEATRDTILNCAIECLQAEGYAATSIEAVMALAGLGRGSVLNQFPTRIDLMAAAAEAAMSRMIEHSRLRLTDLPTPAERLCALADIAWESHNLPEAAALTEVLLASRWDHVLAQRVRPLVEITDTNFERLTKLLARDCRITDADSFLAYGRLLTSCMRGLTIELMVGSDRTQIIHAVETLKTFHASRCEHYLAAQG